MANQIQNTENTELKSDLFEELSDAELMSISGGLFGTVSGIATPILGTVDELRITDQVTSNLSNGERLVRIALFGA